MTVASESESQFPLFSDPLTRRPRISSVVLCVVFGVFFLLLAAATYVIGVRTKAGQLYDDIVWRQMKSAINPLLLPVINFFTNSTYVIGIVIAIGVIALVLLLVRHRWRLLISTIIFALISYGLGEVLKDALPRPHLGLNLANPANSAPSGHMLMAVTAGLVILLTVPRAARALSAGFGVLFSLCVGFSVIVGQWHRPTDVVMAAFLETGFALLVLSATRGSAMDNVGARKSSISVQIVSTVFITFGLAGLAFASYMVFELYPGLALSARWIYTPAVTSASLLILSSILLCFGLVLAFRQLTAAPLSRVAASASEPAAAPLPSEK